MKKQTDNNWWSKACKITQGAKRTHKYTIATLVQFTLNYHKELDNTDSPFYRKCQLDQYAMSKVCRLDINIGLESFS